MDWWNVLGILRTQQKFIHYYNNNIESKWIPIELIINNIRPNHLL
jgi:hypothetical protein